MRLCIAKAAPESLRYFLPARPGHEIYRHSNCTLWQQSPEGKDPCWMIRPPDKHLVARVNLYFSQK